MIILGTSMDISYLKGYCPLISNCNKGILQFPDRNKIPDALRLKSIAADVYKRKEVHVRARNKYDRSNARRETSVR
jgi:hypothetical protein